MKGARKLGVRLVNTAWLVITLIGVPAITGLKFGGLRLSAVRIGETLTLLFIAVAIVGNVVARFALARDGQTRAVCDRWAGVHAFFGVVFLLVFAEIIHFEWLKQWLLWLDAKMK